MEQLKPPSSLCLKGNLAQSVKCGSKYCTVFELYLIGGGISQKTQRIKCATFLRVAGVIIVFNTLVFGEDEKKNCAHAVIRERMSRM